MPDPRTMAKSCGGGKHANGGSQKNYAGKIEGVLGLP